MALPEEFQKRMKEMLGAEYEDFITGYEQTRKYGLRVNTLKLLPEEFEKIAPFEIEKIPWIPNGYYYKEGTFPARHPYYAAGIYYLQEPSAMTPASRLPVKPGERVLDLCAAPGGKATELAARLRGRGVLVANDISASRARALLHNLELFGASNILVTNEVPARLAEVFEGYFDKILVDAPCSGEGMFRKSQEAISAWSLERVRFFAKQQKTIVESAVRMLRPGGMMLYSTCTFSAEENEGTVAETLERFPELELIPMEGYEGFESGRPEWGGGCAALERCVRIWPHKMPGEGHFLALFRKREGGREESIRGKDGSAAAGEPAADRTEDRTLYGEERNSRKKNRKKGGAGKNGMGICGQPDAEQARLLEDFLDGCSLAPESRRLDCRGGKAYAAPELPENLKGIRFLRSGLLLGEFKKGRFEPSQPFAMALSPKNFRRYISWEPDDERVEKYLGGESVPVDLQREKAENGWNLVCVGNFSLGWGKISNGLLKNKYLCGWRKN